jgi:hypothetical protein
MVNFAVFNEKETNFCMHIKHKPLYHNGRYFHPKALCARRSLFDVLLWKTGLYRDGLKHDPVCENSLSIPQHQPADPSCPTVTLDQSTGLSLIKVFGVTVLTRSHME